LRDTGITTLSDRQAIVEAANKGNDTREERDQLVAAAEQGDGVSRTWN